MEALEHVSIGACEHAAPLYRYRIEAGVRMKYNLHTSNEHLPVRHGLPLRRYRAPRSAMLAIVTLLLLVVPPVWAAPTVLYDATLGGLPATQGLFYQGLFASETLTPTGTILNSSANKAFQAGYTAKIGALPALDRERGYTLNFRLALTAEDHAGSDRNNDQIDDRAGFSLILLASDLRGIELGFWQNRIWAQAAGGAGDGALFTQAEGVEFDTTTEQDYLLMILGERYTLSSGNTTLLTGALRDYSSFGAPYTLPNFLFLGDNTTSASATIQLIEVRYEALPYRVVLPLVGQ
jgi:hypothetical protein